MLIKRILAQLIDMLLYLIITGFVLIGVSKLDINDFASVLIVIVGIHALYVLIQYPFYTVGQSVGKGFFRLYVVATKPETTITWVFMLMREVMFKVLPCYLLCVPVFFGNEGMHDKTCNTNVICK